MIENTNCLSSYDGGGRDVEVPFIRSVFSNIKDKYIADFGCVESTGISTDAYNIDKSNTLTYFDIMVHPKFQGRYIVADFLNPNFYKENSFDLGICVSVLEHIGLRMYNNKLIDNGETIALENIIKTIRPGGKLFVTVPASDTYQIIDGWIKSYTPKMLMNWKNIPGISDVSIMLSKYIHKKWYICNENEFTNVQHYSNGIFIMGVACVILTKG
jgi:SAM-dependent methyltransferase